MERELWRAIREALRRLPRRRQRCEDYLNREILAVLMWAALHDRSINWACQRDHWPRQAWRRRLPDQSTMSRRLHDPLIIKDLTKLIQILQRDRSCDQEYILIDSKPLEISEYTSDPDAGNGRGAGRYARGYRLHVIIDATWRLLAWDIEPMNVAECVVARRLVNTAARSNTLRRGTTMLADAGYDSNPLYEAAAEHDVRMIAPRRKPNRSISRSHRQHPDRLRAIDLMERRPRKWSKMKALRGRVEHYFGALASFGGGLWSLPSWSRRLRRVRYWVGSKLAINAARIAIRGVNYA